MSALKKRMTGLLQRKDSSAQIHLQTASNGAPQDIAIPPDASLSLLMDIFFKSATTHDHVGALSLIPDRALDSKASGQEAAKIMRKRMSNWSAQTAGEVYNSVMLIAILARHEQGHLFTSAIDDRFAGTVKQILRDHSESSTPSRYLIRDTVSEFDETIAGRFKESTPDLQATRDICRARWKDDAGVLKIVELRNDPKNWVWLQRQQRQQQRALQPSQQQGGLPTQLPNVLELSERLKEANTSANILEQTMHVHGNDVISLFKDDLFREFSHRCKGANDSLQRYVDLINAGQNTQAYDQDTITEIVTTRTRVGAVTHLQDRKQLEYNAIRNQARSPPAQRSFAPPSGPPNGSAATSSQAPPRLPETQLNNSSARLDNPFDDSNDIARTGDSLQNLRLGAPAADSTSSGRPSLALNTGTSNGETRAVPSSRGDTDEPRVSAESEDASRPRRYVF